MTSTVSRPDPVSARRYRRVPWSPHAWGQVLYLAGAIPVQVIGALIVVGLVRGTELAVPNAALIILLWAAAAAALLILSPALTWVHRHRLRSTAGVVIPPAPRRRNWLSWPGLVALLRAQSTWRRLVYHVLAAPVLAAAAIAAVGLWVGGVVLLFVPFLTWSNGHPEPARPTSQGTPLAHHPLGVLVLDR
jgi:hypothetical protein